MSASLHLSSYSYFMPYSSFLRLPQFCWSLSILSISCLSLQFSLRNPLHISPSSYSPTSGAIEVMMLAGCLGSMGSCSIPLICLLICFSLLVCIAYTLTDFKYQIMRDYPKLLPTIFLLLCLNHCLCRLLPHLQAQGSKQLYFDNQFIQIQEEVDYIERSLKIQHNQQASQLLAISKKVTAGLKLLKENMKEQGLIISEVNKYCAGVTTFNRTAVRKYLPYTEQHETELAQLVATCNSCDAIRDETQSLLNKTENYFRLINQTLDGHFCDRNLSDQPKGLININHTYFKNNLAAKNWYYGSTTPSDYKIQMFKMSTTFNLTTCPIDTPYVIELEQRCISCPKGSFYNLGQKICTVCKTDQIFNRKKETCEECIGDKVFGEAEEATCKPCDTKTQVFNSKEGKCQQCGPKEYIDYSKQTCVPISCPPTSPRFNRQTRQCQPCGTSQMIDPNNPTRCVRTNYIGLCPPSKPSYNHSTRLCQACPQGTAYDRQSQKCI